MMLLRFLLALTYLSGNGTSACKLFSMEVSSSTRGFLGVYQPVEAVMSTTRRSVPLEGDNNSDDDPTLEGDNNSDDDPTRVQPHQQQASPGTSTLSVQVDEDTCERSLVVSHNNNNDQTSGKVVMEISGNLENARLNHAAAAEYDATTQTTTLTWDWSTAAGETSSSSSSNSNNTNNGLLLLIHPLGPLFSECITVTSQFQATSGIDTWLWIASDDDDNDNYDDSITTLDQEATIDICLGVFDEPPPTPSSSCAETTMITTSCHRFQVFCWVIQFLQCKLFGG